ncbi:MAG TPA: response regulator transcription factor [Chthoniobacter sp.]|nr:response regulator transcription factor [Chthoniobacter sp.]
MKAKPSSPSRPTTKTPTKSAPKEPPRKRVFLVDDHPMMLDGMSRLIDSEPGLMCCGGAKSAEEALSKISQSTPDLVITDITLPHRSGVELIKDLTAMHPDVPVFVYSMHDENFYAERALRAGARGYLMKEAGSEMMLEAIRRVLDGEICVSPRIAAKILNLFSGAKSSGAGSPVEKLTDREFDVFRLIGQGKSTKEIAGQLHLSHKTVAVHRGHIKEKLQISSAAELVHQAIRWAELKANTGN